MKLILLYLAVVLCFVGKGKSNSRKNLSPATGGSATQQSNLDDSHAPNLGKSETMLSLLGYLGAFRPVLSGLTSLPRVGGGAHGNIGLRAEISRNGVNLSADKPSEHLSNLFLKGLKGIVEPITSAAGGSVSSAVENLKAQIKKFIEPLTEDHGPTSTSASVSGDSSTSSRLDGHSSDGLSKVSGDDPTVQGHDVAASDGSKQNVEDSTLSTGSATSNEGDDKSSDNSSNTFREDLEKILEQITSAPGGSAERPNAQSSNNLSGKLEPKYENPTNGSSSASSADKPYEEGMRKLLKFLEEQYGQTGTDASVSGMSSESSRSNVHLSDGFSMESGDDATVQGQQAAASGGPKQNVESSNSSTGSATSNGGGDSNEVRGPSSSAVDSTDSGDRGNLADKQGPGFNGPEGVGENNGGSFRAGSLDTGSKSDSGSHNLSSGSGSRSNVSTGGEPSDKNEPADPGVSGRVTCPTGKTQSGSPSVA
ncbi:submandibular gland protein C, isoform CRA_b [Mus musculus]|nr:submandibular gland protein C, isoform CRA_b [Mus musculus]